MITDFQLKRWQLVSPPCARGGTWFPSFVQHDLHAVVILITRLLEKTGLVSVMSALPEPALEQYPTVCALWVLKSRRTFLFGRRCTWCRRLCTAGMFKSTYSIEWVDPTHVCLVLRGGEQRESELGANRIREIDATPDLGMIWGGRGLRAVDKHHSRVIRGVCVISSIECIHT